MLHTLLFPKKIVLTPDDHAKRVKAVAMIIPTYRTTEGVLRLIKGVVAENGLVPSYYHAGDILKQF